MTHSCRYFVFPLSLALLLSACGGEPAGDEGGMGGVVSLDGSSTVYPIAKP